MYHDGLKPGWKQIKACVYSNGSDIVVTGNPHDIGTDEWHNCDAMGCLQEHVLARTTVRKLESAQDLCAPYIPSEDLFERFACSDPTLLLRLLTSDLSPGLLTHAAEIAGRELTYHMVVPALIDLLSHKDAAVREGTVLGLSHHANDMHVIEALKNQLLIDTSPGVIRVLVDILEELIDFEKFMLDNQASISLWPEWKRDIVIQRGDG